MQNKNCNYCQHRAICIGLRQIMAIPALMQPDAINQGFFDAAPGILAENCKEYLPEMVYIQTAGRMERPEMTEEEKELLIFGRWRQSPKYKDGENLAEKWQKAIASVKAPAPKYQKGGPEPKPGDAVLEELDRIEHTTKDPGTKDIIKHLKEVRQKLFGPAPGPENY